VAQAYLVITASLTGRVREFSATMFQGQTNSTRSGNLIVGENNDGRRLPFVSSLHQNRATMPLLISLMLPPGIGATIASFAIG